MRILQCRHSRRRAREAMALDLENKKCVSARGSDVGAMALDLEDKASVCGQGVVM